MKFKLSLILLISIPLILILCSCNEKQITKQDIMIIPEPANIKYGRGFFEINNNTSIITDTNDPELSRLAITLSGRLNSAASLDIQIEGKSDTRNSIILELLDKEDLGDEGYTLVVERKNIKLQAYKPAGLFYGIQTILQLLPEEIFSDEKADNIEWKIPCIEITDKPRFSWRGMHLDVSRHFFPVKFIKKYIDIIALHKMNLFHWHMTDDNGWRIEIKKYPGLTDISAWRVNREEKHWKERESQKDGECATYGGYYTQDEIKEIVEYARNKYVRILPEIEMPGHTSEVFAAYPEYSCTGERFTVRPGSYWPNSEIFCAGNDSVFVFLEDVLSEVIDLFPFEYVHIGGDEADKTRWKECAKCQTRIKNENLKDEDELQSYFIKRIEKILTSKNKRLIGWDEILEGGLAPDATVMSWRGVEGGIAAAKLGHAVVMSPGTHCYFDHYQADPETQPLAIGGYTDLEKVYSFNPVPEELSDDEKHYVLGAQANVWTEYIPNGEHAEYMALPRMTALSEVLWTPENKRDYDSFRIRLTKQFDRFDNLGINYYSE